jgi:heme exporter protein A
VPDTTSDPTLRPFLAVSGLACQRGRQWLFRDLSFSVWPGQMVWLRGPNGSGKTTLLRTVVGLSQPDEGVAQVHGPQGMGGTGAGRVVYIGHLNAMKDDLTVCESLQFIAGIHGQDRSREAALSALTVMGMHHRRNAAVRTLSQGQRRRAALARLALEHEVSLWVLDEPFDALDVEGIQTLIGLMVAHLERGGCVLLTSHLKLPASGPAAIVLTLDEGLVA